MRPTRRQLYLAAAGVAGVGVLIYAFMPRPVPVEIVRVVTGPLRVTIDEDGRTRIKERYVVSAPLAGQLRRIDLHPGDAVCVGKTPVAIIDPSEPDLIDARARAQLDARLRAAEVQVELADPRVARAGAANELAQIELQRAMTLMEKQAIARQALDHARDAARGSAEDLRAAEYARQIARFELEQARAALWRTDPESRPRDGCSELRVLSPINGCVLRIFHEDAAVVMPGARLVELGDPADLEAEIDVLSTDAVRIRPGAQVWFEHWGGDAPLEGRVRVIEPAGFLKISALGVEEQRVNVIVDFVSPPQKRRTLGDAYRVDARIVVWEAEKVRKVPVGALFRNEGQWAVFTARDGRAKLTRVEVGHSDGRETEVPGGLVEGDPVLVHPSDKITDGVRIAVRPDRTRSHAKPRE
jgi:HlyD family secretion protein